MLQVTKLNTKTAVLLAIESLLKSDERVNYEYKDEHLNVVLNNCNSRGGSKFIKIESNKGDGISLLLNYNFPLETVNLNLIKFNLDDFFKTLDFKHLVVLGEKFNGGYDRGVLYCALITSNAKWFNCVRFLKEGVIYSYKEGKYTLNVTVCGYDTNKVACATLYYNTSELIESEYALHHIQNEQCTLIDAKKRAFIDTDSLFSTLFKLALDTVKSEQ